MSKSKKIALWVVTCLLTALFLFAGGSKLVEREKTAEMFVQVGYAAWFATFIGVCEVLGAIGLLIPRLAGLAATGLSIIMVGAFVTLATHHQLANALGPLIILALLLFVGYTRLNESRT